MNDYQLSSHKTEHMHFDIHFLFLPYFTEEYIFLYAVTFNLYDVRQKGCIEREEVIFHVALFILHHFIRLIIKKRVSCCYLDDN